MKSPSSRSMPPANSPLRQPISSPSSGRSDDNNTTSSFREHLVGSNESSIFGVTIQKKTVTCWQLSFLFMFLIVAGAGCFYGIEHPTEVIRITKARADYTKDKKMVMNLLLNATGHDQAMANDLYSSLQPHKLGLQTSANDTDNWTFINAIIFSFTIVTTIGYGTFTPSTSGGQVFLVICT